MGFLYLIESYDKALSAKVHNLTIGAMEYIAVFFGFIFNQYLIWLVPFFTYFKTIENSEFGNNLLGGSHFAEGYGKLGTIAVMYYLFSVVLTVVITQSNKIIFGRVRPALINPNQRFNLRKFEGNCSMPSGDTAQAANWGLFMAINTQNPIYLLAILPVAFARVYFQLHWIGDTVIGTAIGVTCKSTKPKEITPEEIKSSKRLIDKACRKIDRERTKLDREQEKAKKEIAKLAKKGMHKPAKIMARDVAKINQQIEQTYMIQSQLKTISFQLTQAMTTKELGGVMGISAETLAAVNENMKISSIMQVCKEFAKNSDKLESTGEMLNDAFDTVGDAGLDADADKLYEQVLEDQALEINNEGIAVSKSKMKVQADHEEEKDDLESRLAALSK